MPLDLDHLRELAQGGPGETCEIEKTALRELLARVEETERLCEAAIRYQMHFDKPVNTGPFDADRCAWSRDWLFRLKSELESAALVFGWRRREEDARRLAVLRDGLAGEARLLQNPKSL